MPKYTITEAQARDMRKLFPGAMDALKRASDETRLKTLREIKGNEMTTMSQTELNELIHLERGEAYDRGKEDGAKP